LVDLIGLCGGLALAVLFGLLVGGSLHSDIEAVLLLLEVAAEDTPLLELLVHPIGLFVFEIEHLFINEHAVDCPWWVLWVRIVKVLSLDFVLPTWWETHLDHLKHLICATFVVRDVVIGDSFIWASRWRSELFGRCTANDILVPLFDLALDLLFVLILFLGLGLALDVVFDLVK
jgi:hypothetical protein